MIEQFLLWLRPRPQKKGMLNTGKRFTEGLQHPDSLKHARWRLFLGESVRKNLFTAEAFRQQLRSPASHIESLFSENAGGGGTNQQLYVDMKSYLADNCLVKLDRMSMACSLEARVPFLDHELVETAFQMPGHLKVHRGRTKVLLKKVAARHVPHHCIYRSKQGFSIPIKNWLRTRFRVLLEELLSPQRLSREGLFKVETVERLKEEHLQGRVNHSHLLWSLLVFQDWRQRWRV
jgi:asparagine synthase (glutamine-hydrolysing)